MTWAPINFPARALPNGRNSAHRKRAHVNWAGGREAWAIGRDQRNMPNTQCDATGSRAKSHPLTRSLSLSLFSLLFVNDLSSRCLFPRLPNFPSLCIRPRRFAGPAAMPNGRGVSRPAQYTRAPNGAHVTIAPP